MREENLKTRLVTLLFEMLSVIFAVLVALGVNEWRENRANASLAAEALMKIDQEIRNNRDRLGPTLEEQRQEFERVSEELIEVAEPTEEKRTIGQGTCKTCKRVIAA